MSGFCVRNDVAVAIAWLLDHGVERIGYVDVDVHHGDGVQEIFYNDPRVMTVSLHESGRRAVPRVRPSRTEIGESERAWPTVNIALPAGTDDDGWLRAFDAIVPKVLRKFAPQLVSQQGLRPHRDDPLAHLRPDCSRASARPICGFTSWHIELCDGRWLAHWWRGLRLGGCGPNCLGAPDGDCCGQPDSA